MAATLLDIADAGVAPALLRLNMSAAVLELPGVLADGGLMHPIAAVVLDTWIEAVVIAVAIHLYFRICHKVLPWFSHGKDPEATKHKKVGTHNFVNDDGAAADTPLALDTAPVQQDAEAAGVRRLVVTMLRKDNESCEKALAQYRDLIESQMDLRAFLSNTRHSGRHLYVGLIECGVRVAVGQNAEANLDLAWDPTTFTTPTASMTPLNKSAKGTTAQLLKDMRTFGIARGHEFYSSIFKLFINFRLLQDALWLHDAMLADNYAPDRGMRVCLMNVAIACGKCQKALNIFRDIRRTSAPSMRTYMCVLRIFSRRQDWEGAVELLDDLRAKNSGPDALVLNTVMGICVTCSKIAVAERLMHQWQDCADVVSCNILLKGYVNQLRVSAADKLLEQMLRTGPAPNVITYNTLMDCVVRTMQAKPTRGCEETNKTLSSRRTWQLLDEMIDLGLEPDRFTCSTLVKGMHLTGCTGGDIDRAVSLLSRLGPAGLTSPSGAGASQAEQRRGNAKLMEVLFNSLLDACVSIRDLDRLTEICSMMDSFKVEVSAVTYSTLIKAFGQAGKLDLCHEVWKNMGVAKVPPTIVTYGCYIDACTRNLDLAAAERVCESMREAGVTPNAVIYTSLIRGYAVSRNPVRALELYKEMREAGIEASAVTFNSVLDMLSRQLADPAKLHEIIRDMKAASVEPDIVTYSILVKASCNSGNVDNAIDLFRQLRGHGLSFDEVAFNTLLLACSRADRVNDAEEIFNEMLACRVAPTHVTTSILVKMYGKAKMLDKAIDVSILVQKEFDQRPNLFVYTCLIQACVRNKQVRKSWDIFGNMLVVGMSPDAITYGTLIHGCIYNNRLEQAVALVCYAYQVPSPDGRTIFQALGMEAQGEALPRASKSPRPLQLQSEVLHTLCVTLKRKDQVAMLHHLQKVCPEAVVPLDPHRPGAARAERASATPAARGDAGGGRQPRLERDQWSTSCGSGSRTSSTGSGQATW